jgi:hypothetical protein
MLTQYHLVQSRKTASGGCSDGPRFVRACSTTGEKNLVTMEHIPNPQFSKTHITILNPNNFKMIEAMGLKIIAWRSL